MLKKIVVIGGAGNVGIGITKAFKKHDWKVKIIDPRINSTFEKLYNPVLKKILTNVNNVIYCAEIGNRDLYAENPNLENENNLRFKNFCKKLYNLNPNITIWYVGGSWTKRKPNKNWLVTDKSPNKDLKECNPYEKAKISAEANAKKLSILLNIRFLDWASIVPNLSENFSIPKMATQALKERKITYSSGNFGRPLLESLQAGKSLLYLIKNDKSQKKFKKFLIPGVFIPFNELAKAVKEVIEKETKTKIKLEKQVSTPNFLKSKTRSNNLKKLGFKANKADILSALHQNVLLYLNK